MESGVTFRSVFDSIYCVLCRWLMLMASRYLGWSHERILPHAPLFHLASWGIPAALSISVLVLRYVDADELTGKYERRSIYERPL